MFIINLQRTSDRNPQYESDCNYTLPTQVNDIIQNAFTLYKYSRNNKIIMPFTKIKHGFIILKGLEACFLRNVNVTDMALYNHGLTRRDNWDYIQVPINL